MKILILIVFIVVVISVLVLMNMGRVKKVPPRRIVLKYDPATYLGAFFDDPQNRALPEYLGMARTLEEAKELARAKEGEIGKIKYIGLQYWRPDKGGQIWAGTADATYDMHGRSSDTTFANGLQWGKSYVNAIYVI